MIYSYYIGDDYLEARYIYDSKLKRWTLFDFDFQASAYEELQTQLENEKKAMLAQVNFMPRWLGNV